jgi:aminopeptidase N
MNSKITKQSDYKAANFVLQDVNLEFILNSRNTTVTNTMRFINTSGDIILDGVEVELISIFLNNKKLNSREYKQNKKQITIFSPPKISTIEITTNISPILNSRLEGLYVSDDIFVTQCEAQGFRRITYFPDRPDILSVYTVKIIGDKKKFPVMLSNGNLTSKKIIKNNLEVVWHDPFPKPCYLFALVAGKLAKNSRKFLTKSNKHVDLNIWIRKEDKNKVKFAMDSLVEAMKWDEQKYNLEYDLSIFNIAAINNFNMGAMENKSLNIFNSKYLISDSKTSTDNEYDFIETIVAHEYFHNWTGNRITCRDWFQLSLKEGLTVYRDQEFSSDMGSRAVKRIKDVRLLRTVQFAEDAGPLAHSVRPKSYAEINNFYTSTVYNKGAELIRMLESILSEKGFLKGFKYYIKKYDGMAATCENFISSMEKVNNINLKQFYLWYSQAGTPEIEIEPYYNKKAKTLELKIKQIIPNTPKQKNKKPMLIPLKLSLLGNNGEFFNLSKNKNQKELLLIIKRNSQKFLFENITSLPAISINRGFTSPVKINLKQNINKLNLLMMYDNDPFTKWDTLNKYFLNLCLKQSKSKNNVTISKSFMEIIKNILKNSYKDPSFTSELLSVPSENEIAEHTNTYDPENIHKARISILKNISSALNQQLNLILEKSYKNNSTSREWRSLHNVCLEYLTADKGKNAEQIAFKAYNSSDNMTIQLFSLTCIINIKGKQKDKLISDFYQKYKDQPTMIEKWLQIQASAKIKNNLNIVKKLIKLPIFDYKSANKVRAVLTTFAKNNSINFHHISGSGYKFIADQIIHIDTINPSSASGLATSFSSWKKLDRNRRKTIKEQLLRIRKKENLSTNTFEIIDNIIKS